MKKILKRAVALAMGAATLCLGAAVFAGCDGGYENDSTIRGMFSDEEFNSEQDAVKALQDELGGEMYKVTVLKYAHESKVPKTRIRELNTENLGKDEKVASGRRVLVTCAQKSNVDESADAEEKSFHAEIYEVKLGDETHFRYYVNKSDYEGMIPKSYFDYLNDLEGMENFTFKSTETTSVKIGGEEQTVITKMTAEVEKEKFSLHCSQGMINLWLYAEEENDQTKVWTSTNGEDYEEGKDLFDALGAFGIGSEEDGDVDGISSGTSIEFDQTYLRLLPDGTFGLREECNGRFMEAYTADIKEMLGATSGKVNVDGNITFDMSVNEYGLSHVVCEAKITLEVLGISAEGTIKFDYEFTNVGTTKVERPEGIK